MTFNSELAHQILDEIQAHPQNHNQGYWITLLGSGADKIRQDKVAEATTCDTAGCFAGWACLIEDTPKFNQIVFDGQYEGAHAARYYVDEEQLRSVSVEIRATELLGLDDVDAAMLFTYNNSLETLKFLVEEFDKGRSHDDRDPETGYTLADDYYAFITRGRAPLDNSGGALAGCGCTSCENMRTAARDQLIVDADPEPAIAIVGDVNG